MPKTTGEVTVRPFADFLRDQNKGRTHEELSQSLHDLIGRIKETGKKGELTLKITVEPNKKNPDDDGNLSRTDPQQLTFDGIREVPPVAPADIKTKEKQA